MISLLATARVLKLAYFFHFVKFVGFLLLKLKRGSNKPVCFKCLIDTHVMSTEWKSKDSVVEVDYHSEKYQ